MDGWTDKERLGAGAFHIDLLNANPEFLIGLLRLTRQLLTLGLQCDHKCLRHQRIAIGPMVKVSHTIGPMVKVSQMIDPMVKKRRLKVQWNYQCFYAQVKRIQ